MKIIKPGVPKGLRIYSGDCMICRCKFEFHGLEAISHTSFLCSNKHIKARCPECHEWFFEREWNYRVER